MSLLLLFSLSILFGTIDNCEVYIKTNQWPGRSVIVQLFEWKWLDIADECEKFLGPKRYGGVQISPPSENLIITGDDGSRPWYERYQVMSYKLTTRSGNEADFLAMTSRCNKVGVRIYADVVFNHMTGNHDTSLGTGGSKANFSNFDYPAVPYTREHFNQPECDITDYNSLSEVRVCQLVGLKDLNQTMPYVRQKIVQYLNHLINLGVAGFRVDAAKHMYPEYLKEIYKYLNNLNTRFGFRRNSRAYIYQEVTKGGAVQATDYKSIGDVTEFTVGTELSKIFSGKSRALKSLATWGSPSSWDLLPSDSALVFMDNHDTQRYEDGLTYKNGTLYKVATAFLLAHSYGQARIMSSYAFDDIDVGPPTDDSDRILSPDLYDDPSCGGGWICEHRWPALYQMVAFRNEVRNTQVNNWWDNGRNQIAFSRGNRGFIVFNTEGTAMDRWLQTGLPTGNYCDIISGQKEDNSCTGKTIAVSDKGLALIKLSGINDDIYLAIHVGEESMLNAG